MPSERLRHGSRSRSSRSGHRRRVSVSPMPRREQSRPQNTATRSKAPPPAVPPKLTINVRPDQIKIEVYDTATLSDPHVQSMFQAISMGAQSAPSAPDDATYSTFKGKYASKGASIANVGTRAPFRSFFSSSSSTYQTCVQDG